MVKTLTGATLLVSFSIYAIHCIYRARIVTTLLTNPQPIIIRHEVLDLNHSLWRQSYNQEIPVINSEMPLSYSDVFYARTEFLCAAPTGYNYGISMTSYERETVCFLRLSAEDANWIRETFANLQPGQLFDRNDYSWGISWSQEGFDYPSLHANPLEEMDDADAEKETTGVVFLKWVALRFLINQVGMNPNNLIHYSEVQRYGFSLEKKRELRFIPYNPTIPKQAPRCSFSCFRTEYYIPLQGNFLFRIERYGSHYM
ncbi:hypothetical protein [Leptospira weilii]|uniref:hypothetical protein n=1 Tax=Leptospira weilii TaxID=28184 RepID=UPI001EF23809|nr:hypothetical protein [Leptospira weilii]ULH28890.1 hypothetical protein FH586_02780 [Leptospira weilii]